jgi:uncharacterized repeat protein (TIGR02543 family)
MEVFMKRSVIIISLICFIISSLITFPIRQGKVYAFSSGSYEYIVNGDEATITKYTGMGGYVSIPGIIDGYTVTRIGFGAFQNHTSLFEVVFSGTITDIGGSAFYGCSSLESVVLSDYVTYIGESAFSNCSRLKSMTIPKGVTSIGDYAFGNGSSLTAINVDSENKVYSSVDGILYDKLNTTLVAYPAGKPVASFTIPSTVTAIGAGAFYSCSNLTSITIPEGVTSIGSGAFEKCSNLSSVTIPSSVTSIGNIAFSSCSSLTEAKFLGNAPAIGQNVFYDAASDFKVYYFARNTEFTSPWYGYPTAIIEQEDYTVIYRENGSTGGTAPVDNKIYLPDESITVIGNIGFLTKNGYAFSGWNTKADGSGITYGEGEQFTIGTADVILYAMWLPDYEYSVDGKNATITKYIGKETDITIPSMIDGYVVAKIGGSAFALSTSIKSVTLPESITGIEDNAFNGATSLSEAYFLGNAPTMGKNVFYNCASDFKVIYYASKKRFTNPWNGYPTITYQSVYFDDYYKVQYVVTPDGITISRYTGSGETLIPNWINGTRVTSIGDYAYAGANLTGIRIPSNITNIGYGAFMNCPSVASVDIPNSVTRIGDFAFSGCISLKSITIPSSVISIGDGAFSDCSILAEINVDEENKAYSSNLGILYDKLKTALITYPASRTQTSFSVPDSVKEIGYYAFYGGSNLTSVTIPNTVISIGDYAFQNCSSLTSMTIPDSVTRVGNYAFNYCSGLTKVTISSILASIGDYAFQNCSSLTSITIPEGVTRIGKGAFKNCRSLTSVTIPNSVTLIGNYAFENCNYLANLTIPDSVTSIGEGAFSNCYRLSSVTIPSSVTNIGNFAFRYSNLIRAKFLGNAPTVGADVFQNSSSVFKIYYHDEKTGFTNPWYGYPTESIESALNTVTYDGNGSTGGTAPIDIKTYLPYEYVTVAGNTGVLVKTGYIFSGWNTKSDGSGTTYSEGAQFSMGAENIALYAIWLQDVNYQPFEYTVDGNNAIITNYKGTRSDIAIPSTIDGYRVTRIDDYAFYKCTGLKSVTIPNSVTSIESNAFAYCSGLTSVIIPNSVTRIGYGAFEGCTSLTSVTIPSSVTRIEDYAFRGVANLNEAKFLGNSPTMGYNVFYGSASGFKVYYVAGKVGFYSIWYGYQTVPMYTVNYDSNGSTSGSVPIDDSTYLQGKAAAVLGNTGSLTKTGYTFDGWNTQADGKGVDYAAGATLTMKAANVKLYAKWKADMYDINEDGTINILDLASAAQNYNTTSTEADWNSRLDVNNDNIVDIFDLVLVSKKIQYIN